VLESQARSRSLPLRVVERARIVLFAAAGRQDKDTAVLLSMTPKKVSRWRKRFLALWVAGLLKDAPPARTQTRDQCAPHRESVPSREQRARRAVVSWLGLNQQVLQYAREADRCNADHSLPPLHGGYRLQVDDRLQGRSVRLP
jgi:Homeodomain-like domain